MLKKCKKHGLTEHSVPKNKNQGGVTCRKCRVEQVTRRRHKVRKILIEEAGGECSRCGYNKCIWALEFHHRNPAEKKFGISNKNIMFAINTLREEAKKCDLLCANCHREVEYDGRWQTGNATPC